MFTYLRKQKRRNVQDKLLQNADAGTSYEVAIWKIKNLGGNNVKQ